MYSEEQLAKTLQEAGFEEKEAKVYVALCSLGSSTAYHVAERCGVKKPTVYVILEDLRKKGLVLKVPHAKKALFSPVPIEEYVREKRKKLEAVSDIASALQNFGSATRPNVYFFTGLRGLAEALEYKIDSMQGKTFHSFYGNLMGSSEEVKRLYSQWDKRALDNDITFKILMPSESPKKYFKDLIEFSESHPQEMNIKYLQNYLYPPHISVEIAETFVRIDDAKNLQVTIIDDPATAEAFRQIFNVVWNATQGTHN